MQRADLRSYRASTRADARRLPRPRRSTAWRRPSSGGTTVGEALNILENVDLGAMYRADDQALHDYLEASALAFADRGTYVGDPAYVDVPIDAAALAAVRRRAVLRSIDQTDAATKPVPAGTPDGTYDTNCDGPPRPARAGRDHEGLSTTHLDDRRQVGQRRDLHADHRADRRQRASRARAAASCSTTSSPTSTSRRPPADDPNLPGAGQAAALLDVADDRTEDGKPVLALGSPGGSTIITTVLQILLNRLDLGMTLPEAIADAAGQPAQHGRRAGRAAPSTRTGADGAWATRSSHPPAPGEIGAATGIEFLPSGRLLAVGRAGAPRRR